MMQKIFSSRYFFSRTFLITLFLIFSQVCAVAHIPTVCAEKYSAIIVDQTGRVLFARNENKSRHPASLTKIMTLYLTFAALDSGRLRLNQLLPVSRNAANQAPSRLGLKPGETISVRNAILAVVTKSANDAAMVLAETIGGSESNFCNMMTTEAHKIGMRYTNYVNPNGLPDPHQVTTARDLAVLAIALINRFPGYYHYFNTKTFAWRDKIIVNHNHLLGKYPGIDGIKTGYINASGFNLVASAVRGHRRIIAVLMGGLSAKLRDKQMTNMLDWAFQH